MINKRTGYNKAIDSLVNEMVTGHDNEAEEYIYFHDNMHPTRMASAQSLVGASKDELIAITQYRYNLRQMFNTNEFNKNPKTDVFRYVHISEILKPENIVSQTIDVRINIDNETDTKFVIETRKDESDPVIVFEDDANKMFSWLIGDFDNVIAYSINDFDYRKMSSIIGYIDSSLRSKSESIDYLVEITITSEYAIYKKEYALYKGEKKIKKLKVSNYLGVSYNALNDTISVRSNANSYISATLYGIGMNKNISHEVYNNIDINSIGKMKSSECNSRVRNRDIMCSINTSYSDMSLDTSVCLGSQSQNAFSIIDDKSYHMDGAIAISKEINKNRHIYRTNKVILNPKSNVENFTNILKAIDEVRVFNWNVFYIVPVTVYDIDDIDSNRETVERVIKGAVQNIKYEINDPNRFTDLTSRINPAHVIIVEEEPLF